jgi:hypothetical protein
LLVNKALEKTMYAAGGNASYKFNRIVPKNIGPEQPIEHTPENQQLLYDLGKKNYMCGSSSFTPEQAEAYKALTESYNFPSYVGEAPTLEDEKSLQLQHLQHNLGDRYLCTSFKRGGKVAKNKLPKPVCSYDRLMKKAVFAAKATMRKTGK